MLRVRRLAPWITALAGTLLAVPASGQGNIDAGRTPAQIFADTCAACHRSARELKRPTVGFLRQHYTAGSDEASAMANYLVSAVNDPRGAQPKRPPGSVGDTVENAKQQPKQQPKQQAQPVVADQPKAAQAQPKGRRPATTAEVRSVVPAIEELHPEPAGASPARPVPVVLEPFEE